MHKYNTLYSTKQNLYKFRVKTNIGKQLLISFVATDIWNKLPTDFKEL